MDFSPDDLTCISFCTGGGGLDLAVELAIPSARAVVLVEREAYACAVLVEAQRQGLLAPAPICTDARAFPGRKFRGLVDGFFGGIPCQPHSEAGLQLGEDDERDLWSAARRAIVQSGCWWVLIENVGGMLHSGGAERVFRDLRRLGFSVEIGLFTAEECCTEEDGGPSHERERLFILAVADSRCDGQLWSAERDIGAEAGQPAPRRNDAQRRDPHEELADAENHLGRRGERGAETGTRAAELGRLGPTGGSDLVGGVGQADPPGEGPQGSGSSRVQGGELPAAERGGGALADTIGGERDGRPEEPGRRSPGGTPAGRASTGRLFVPGPDEWGAWGQLLDQRPDLEPAVRRGADVLAHRVERLRLLGNGVVPVEGGYALRYLATSLALRGSSGAARLVRLMGL